MRKAVPVDVSMTDKEGKRHTLRLEASSLFRAALNYDCHVTCLFSDALGMPKPDKDTILEVRVVGQERVYRVRYGRAMEWANAEAERMYREERKRR